jgi:hypothetical protein
MDDFIGGGRRGSSVPSISGYVAPLDGAPYRDEEDKKGKVGSEGGKGMNILGKMMIRGVPIFSASAMLMAMMVMKITRVSM